MSAPERDRRLSQLVEALAEDPHAPTAITDPAEAMDRHVADSLSGLEVSALTGAARICDIGSGAGFPGLPLAIALPDTSVDLVEANRRSCEAIERLIAAVGLSNARVVCERAEDWRRGADRYEAVTARALAPLAVLVEYAAPLLAPGGVLVAWKGRRNGEEEAAGAEAAAEVGLEPRLVKEVTPFAAARHRNLHVFQKVEQTPDRFPRRAGIAAKRPLSR